MTLTAIAFDYGVKNIGVAAGQSLTQTASELNPIPARDGTPDWDQIEQLLKEWRPDVVIVGLPLNMDDSESEFSVRTRKFANRVHGRFGVKVELMDERLSTRDAKDAAQKRGHKGNYGKNPIDSIAARLILESWFAVHG
ncbi:Holliday junction resolvase RuvX [Marinibactrum halimedae]|uniref:Putative pre-16S rRNA nuclease n=1 Tax=Marinibactrum halimedae TaxID=1444977 RepID=A0AA37WPA8_9GAMM|nr:Holliday junction resolvase RuvX [Marinibactrum halimedae]MCD9458321.1 Holliday junction resolvase RuvX [Marinibactrum halimedae]GLS27051.1 putative pre-16S rRNA nuclease [Marinibactrum halimedae]